MWLLVSVQIPSATFFFVQGCSFQPYNARCFGPWQSQASVALLWQSIPTKRKQRACQAERGGSEKRRPGAGSRATVLALNNQIFYGYVKLLVHQTLIHRTY